MHAALQGLSTLLVIEDARVGHKVAAVREDVADGLAHRGDDKLFSVGLSLGFWIRGVGLCVGMEIFAEVWILIETLYVQEVFLKVNGEQLTQLGGVAGSKDMANLW